MDEDTSFGYWIQRRRKSLDLTQNELARRVCVSVAMIRRLEADERRPSKEVAARLAQMLEVPADDQATFLKVARAERTVDHLQPASTPSPPVDSLAVRTSQRRQNLPAQTTPLIGRDHEVAAVTSLLRQQDVRLLTMTGPGGIGKTRLALAVAHVLLQEFADGVWFVDLAPTRDPALVTAAIAQVLGVKERGELPLLESLKATLRDRRLLLVLDNFEQVTSAAPHIADLLQAAVRLTVLVTSRVTLHLSGEHEVAVAPLALPDPHHMPPLDRLGEYAAVDLFLQRCQAARADFQVTAATAAAVAEICVRLDGLPLALELAAARSKMLAPQALLARLSNRLKLLTGGARNLPPRQQTLRGTIDWSFSLLDASEQRLFTRLGVFVGGWTLEAAEAVCDAAGDLGLDVLDGLQSLLDKSLLRQEGKAVEPRFAMLETIREYALERLGTGPEAAAIRRHAAQYFLRWAETAASHLHGQEQVSWFTRLAADSVNLRVVYLWMLEHGQYAMAARLGVALWMFFKLADRYSEGLNWLEQVLAVTEQHGGGALAPKLRAQVLARAADLAWRIGDHPRARSYAYASMQLCDTADDTWGRAFVWLVLGHVAGDEFDTAAAAAAYTRSLALFQAVGDEVWIAWGHFDLGTVAFAQRDYGSARLLMEDGLRRFRRLGNTQGIAITLQMIGQAAHAQGDRAAAWRCLEESAALQLTWADTSSGGERVLRASYAAWLQGEHARATALLEQALPVGETLAVVMVPLILGYYAEDQGDHERARTAGEESLLLFRELGATQALMLMSVLSLLGHIANEQGDGSRAQRHFAECLALYRDQGWTPGSARCLVGLARAAHGTGEDPAGDQRAARLLGAAEALPDPISVGSMLGFLERTHYDRERTAARHGLDHGSLAAAWAEGRAMSPEQAIAYALEPTS